MSTIKNKTTIEVLTEARRLIAKGWTQREAARGKRGDRVDPMGRSACKFCALGAIMRATKSFRRHIGAESALEDNLPGTWCNIVRFNDSIGTTQKMVLEAYDRAIQSLQGQQEHDSRIYAKEAP